MMYVDFKVGNEEYKLRLNTRNIVTLEQKLGCNPLGVFGDGEIPKVTKMLDIFHASLQQYQHNIKFEDAYNIFDEWLADGHTVTDFAQVILDIYKVSGIVPEDVETEKN